MLRTGNFQCNAPVGISAVVYITNPRVIQIISKDNIMSEIKYFQPDGIFANRLAQDTLILDCKISDRNNLPSDLESVFDPPDTGFTHFNVRA